MSKKKPGTALVNWEAEFANLAKDDAKNIKVTQGKFISLQGGRMKFNGEEIPDNELDCVVIARVYHNTYYDPKKPYNPKNPQTPICYAFGTNDAEMVVHEDSPEPQNDGCSGCPLNEFGSSDKGGNSKACKNTVRLAVIASSDLDNLDEAEVVYVSVPPASIRNWHNYLKKELDAKVKRPVWAVVTKMKLIPDATSQFKLTFKVEELIDNADLFPKLKELHKENMDSIVFPYTKREEEPAQGKKKSKFSRR